MNRIELELELEKGAFDAVSPLAEHALLQGGHGSDRVNRLVREAVSAFLEKPHFLEQPIDREAVSAYTRYKYPALPVNSRIQEMLLKQIDGKRYRTLKDLDRAVVAASEAVSAYQREAPDLFEAGTDYITKSLGFVDAAFRQRHAFAPQTRQAFVKFASLVKSDAL
jgi:hypothetical protein